MANYREDIVDVELTSGTVHRSNLNHTLGGGDYDADRFGVRAFRNSSPENLPGNVSGYFVRADGYTVAIPSGVVSANKAYITLPAACYEVEGKFTLSIKLTGSGINGTIRIVDGVVARTSTAAAASSTLVPNVESLIDEIETAAAAIPEDYSELSAFIINRAVHFPNIGSAAYGALTMSYNSSTNVYSVTVNNDFACYGFNWDDSPISIGKGNNIAYPMPSSFNSEAIASAMVFLCFDLDDTGSTTWQILKYSDFVDDTSLVPICAMYHEKAFFFENNLKVLFTNSVTDDAFLTYEKKRIAESALFYPYLCNATALIRGSANLISSEYKVVFTNPVFAPTAYPGGIEMTNISNTVTVDWSAQQNPGYARCIYFDNVSKTFEAIYDPNLTLAESEANRRRKNSLSLVCIVYQGTFVYTCGACTPGKWFVNGNDIYGGASEMFQSDLYKTFKKVGVVGDSLSVGYMYNKETETATSRMLEYSWPKQAMRDAGGNPWLNLGTSGQNVLTWCSNATYGKVQAEASGNKCQAYIIGLGENDQSDGARGVPLGTSSDIVDDYTQVATTYYGGYARIIQILKHINPDCKIFCLTNPRTGGDARAEYNVAVRYIAGTYYTAEDNVFLVDLANNDAQLFNGGTFLPTDAADITGGHYSAVGYTRIATVIESAIDKAIEANQAQFVDVAFVAYDTGTPTANTMTE